ncbi:MAG: Increased rDNA silencing protein [Geoglossum umbratile]|nr:MAG: Increased rDNA silencing protein [Geoglossum umbratile]
MTSRPRSRTRSPQREHRSSYHPENEDQSAALRGASLAFVQAPVKPKTIANTYSGTNGAMAAATLAGTRSNSPAKNKPPPQPAENRGGAGPGDAPLSAAQQSFVRGQVARDLVKSSSSSSLRVIGDESLRSLAPPSNIAATIATARFTPQNTGNTLSRPSRSPDRANSPTNVEGHPDALPVAGSVRTAKQHFMRLDQNLGEQSISVPRGLPMVNKDFPADTTSISPATTLIGLFEHNHSNIDPSNVNGRPLKSISAAHTIQSPRPVRPVRPPSRSTPLTAAVLAAQKSMPSKKEEEASGPHMAKESQYKVNNHTLQNTPPLSSSRHTQPLNTKTASLGNDGLALETSESPLKLPAANTPPGLRTKETTLRPASLKTIEKANAPPANSKKIPPAPDIDSDDSSSVASYVSAPDPRTKPVVPPPRRQRSNAQRISPLPPLRVDQVPPITAQKRTEPFEGDQKAYPTTQVGSGIPPWSHGMRAPSPGERLMHIPAQRTTPHLTGEYSASAISASSLASSRAPSPPKSPAPPPLPKRHHRLLNQHHHHQSSRTPSPTKGMRHTMRKPKSDDESQSASTANRKGRRNLITKAPNKHHEGNRRRWRDEITDRERKRYEGVWAANKGLHISITLETSQSVESLAGDVWREDVSNLIVRDIWSRSRLEDAVLEEIWDLVDRRGIGRLTREEFVIGMWLIDQRLKGRKLPVKISASVWDSVRKLGKHEGA